VVDSYASSGSTGYDVKVWESLKYFYDTQAWLPRNIVIVNKEAFDKLTPSEQKAVQDAAKTAEDRGWKMSIEEMTIKTKALKDAGIIVLPPSAELKAGLAKIGATITADDAYIRESILQPTAKLVAGYQPLMPTFQGQLTEEQILALTTYIKSLKDQSPPATGAGIAPLSGKK